MIEISFARARACDTNKGCTRCADANGVDRTATWKAGMPCKWIRVLKAL